MLRENLSINVTPGGVPVIIHISQYDIGLRTFVFSPYTSHGTFTPDAAAAATLEGTKPDGNIIVHNCEYNASTGEITYTVQEQLAAVSGKVWSKLTIRDTSGGVIGYAAIIWMVDMAGVEDGAIASDSDISALQEFIAEFGTINAYKAALDGALAAVGGPYVASTVSQMTDHTKVYVYTGSQTGYTAGHWYYWDGSAWTDGGVYQAAAVETDTTLTVSGMAADAKATGDQITELKNDIHDVAVATYKVTVTKGVATNTSGKLVPFVAKNGDSITAYTVDGSTFGDVQLRFYDASKTYIKHWTLAAGYGKTRTFTFDQATEAYYVGATTVNTSSPSDYYVINNNNIYKQANDELQSQTATVQANIDVLEGRAAIKNIINRFDKSTISAGKYINVTNGTLADSADFFASDFIYIGDLDRVTVSYTHLFCWYDVNKAYITPNPSTMNSRTNDLTFDVPENAKYLRFSTYNADLNLSQVGEAISRANYVPYGNYTLPGFVVGDVEKIVVDASGNGDYTSITDALFGNVDSGIDIVVKPGTYDIAAEYVAKFGQTAVDNMQDSDTETFNGFQFGAIIRNRKITFETGSHVVCDWTGHTVDNTHRFSPIRVDYNAEVIGLHLTAIHTFYAIHDDYGLAVPYTVKYENCHIIGSNLVNANCIGGGCKKYSRHIIKNCYFNNGMNSGTTVRYHNTNVDGSEPEIYVSDSYFNGAFTPRWYGSQTTKMRVYVNNCEARSIHKMAESSSATVDNVELYKWCNTESNPES